MTEVLEQLALKLKEQSDKLLKINIRLHLLEAKIKKEKLASDEREDLEYDITGDDWR